MNTKKYCNVLEYQGYQSGLRHIDIQSNFYLFSLLWKLSELKQRNVHFVAKRSLGLSQKEKFQTQNHESLSTKFSRTPFFINYFAGTRCLATWSLINKIAKTAITSATTEGPLRCTEELSTCSNARNARQHWPRKRLWELTQQLPTCSSARSAEPSLSRKSCWKNISRRCTCSNAQCAHR